jgi:para-aminobenzoate synthetase/4-amino-4-deoxychorismate lyase
MNPIKPQSPLVQINEVLLKENGKWLHFAEPHRIIQADELRDVIPALRELDDLLQANQWHAAGFLSYEAAPAFDPAHRTQPGTGFPYLWFGLYSPPRIVTLPEAARPKETLSWLPAVDRDTYNAAIEQIRSYIADGRTYQVNYTMRLQADFKVDPWNFFLHLAQTQNNHAAYIDTGRYAICSASPELFFQLDGDSITCRPMKGTTSRGRTTSEDSEQAQWLKASEKNRAENVMIVDMIRNDLGRIAKVGSVHVPELFTVEKYPTLWQMTSTVTAKTDVSIKDIFTALFPCASITGAPKVSTMRIISELETTPRKIYTGSIGYIAPDRKAKFNVAIRTALVDRATETAEYGIGGGIVWDSTSTDEYAEALLKARVLTETSPEFSLLETLLWTPDEGFFLREKHIARLLDSANYFGFPISSNLRWSSSLFSSSSTAGETGVSRPLSEKGIIEAYLDDLSSQFASAQRVRLLLDKTGKLNSEVKSFQPSEGSHPCRVCLAKQPVNSNDIFLFHKTTKRDVYEAARRGFPEYDDVLLYNERGELTEFTTGNLVVEMGAKLFTPPIESGLLAGTFREHLLETDQAEERIIRVEELKECAKVYLVNSVRKWQTAILEYK